MLADVVDWRRRQRRALLLRQQTPPDERQRSHDNHQARDPQQPDWSLVTKLITQRVAEVGKVQQNENR